ncbi:MAG TPA: hypothetical protein VL728_10175 [Cyclobacteriaceae bacterium]|jgi:hypothetical protein|nr:hypothetical protein [Cyclobacteriaceae bacterium]
MKRVLIPCFIFWCAQLQAQHFNLGFTFQYHILKQVEVKNDQIIAAHSYSLYKVIDNRWKFFTAGQSLVVGTIAQVDFKKFYFGIEPSFELNTYEYLVGYPTSSSSQQTVRFHTLFLQVDVPTYVGYMFKSSNLFRYSVYAGASPVIPYHLETSVKVDQGSADNFDDSDLQHIVYSTKPYVNSVVGFAIHYASLGRLDIRYTHRMNSVGPTYQTTFNTVGAGLTFFLPLHLFKKKIYYEE